MTETVTQAAAWSPEALFNKTLLFVGEMERYAPDDWQHRLWASLSLEMLARAALAGISPTLLADGRDWRNIHHALGHPPTAKRFAPKSLVITQVLEILQSLLRDFVKELHDACVEQCGNRNAELHSGEDAFAGGGTSSWLPQYYASCQVFLRSLGKELDELFADPELAGHMIVSLQDTAAKSVKKDIHDRSVLWKRKGAEEQSALTRQAAAWATRYSGHRTTCPACGSAALLRGSAQGSVSTEIKQETVVQKQTMLPSAFECIACGLKISGLSKLSACGLGDAFVSTTKLSPAEFFGLYTEHDLEDARAGGGEPEWAGEDFNEY